MSHIIGFFASVFLSALIALWFAQNSINAYWQQTYHQDSFIASIDNPLWQAGGDLQQKILAIYEGGNQIVDTVSVEPVYTFGDYWEDDPVDLSDANYSSDKVFLHKNDKVFFAGDSMMQGVAPFVRQWLTNNHKMDSIDLSKQSTGLSYPKSFDWPATIQDTFAKNPDIGLLVVFLGPNDPWNMPNPIQGQKFLSFASPEWDSVYSERIQNILNTAKSYNARVIWLGIPFMKKEELNKSTRHLDGIIAQTVGADSNAIYLPTEAMLSDDKSSYQESIIIDEKMTKVRTKDGIHFTVQGQKHLANYVIAQIEIQE